MLIFVPAALIFVFQNKQLGDGTLGRGAQALAALFQSVTTRTAGFNSVNLDSLTPNSQLLMVLLMLIGGSPGSTAGGVKTTTVVVLLLCVRASLRREDELECFGRRIDRNVLKNAVTIATSYLVLTVAGAMALSQLDGASLMEAMFENLVGDCHCGLNAWNYAPTRHIVPLDFDIPDVFWPSGLLDAVVRNCGKPAAQPVPYAARKNCSWMTGRVL